MIPPLITLEEHYYSDAILNSFEGTLKAGVEAWPGALEKLKDANELRLQDMDKGKVSFQIVSHCVADRPPPAACRAGNDSLAADIQRSKTTQRRLAGFAVLPMHDPQAAVTELERCVKELKFVGALVDNKAGNKFYDGEEYQPFWQKAEELDVPIYLHPSWPSNELFQQSYAGNYSTRAMSIVGGAQWGWHSEVGLHVLRLQAAGVFERFPKLKIIIGHFGEMMPFMLQRIQDQELIKGPRRRSFLEVWNENIWITTSGCWSLDPMRCILSNTKIDHILYSVDYPFTTNERGLKFMEDLANSNLVTEEQLEKIAYKNAEALLGVKAPTDLHVNGTA
jgi:predicted TIM-barrel fold metal-dependent hydrolase